MTPSAKDEKTEIRKRKSGGSSSGGGKDAGAPKVSKVGLYKSIYQLEESQSEQRDPVGDAKINSDTIQGLKKFVKEVHDAKAKKSQQAATEIADLRVQANLQFLTLKKLNRLDKLRVRSSREATSEAKARVDALHLQLQNLLYEVLHLQKEVTKCQQFKSKDEDIDLIPLEEFYEMAPAEIARKNDTMNDSHQQHLARLEYENVQRQDMHLALQKLDSARDKLNRQIHDKQERLANLDPQLRDILEKTKPVQDYLKMPMTKEKEEQDMARYLPKALFVLYSQTKYYGQACDPSIEVHIKGNVEDAKLFKVSDKGDDDIQDDDEATEEANDDDDSRGKKGRTVAAKGSAKPTKINSEEQNNKLFKKHPLQVQVKLSLGHEDTVTLLFSFLHALQVVGVKVILSLGKEHSKSVGSGVKEALQATALFSHLMEADPGNQSPNPASSHLLKQLGLQRLTGQHLADIGCLYIWSQTLAGITYSESIDDASGCEDGNPLSQIDKMVSETQVETIVNALKARTRARIGLQSQLANLFRAKIVPVEPHIPAALKSAFPSKTRSKIRNWTSVDWEQYITLGVTQHLVKSRAVDGNDFFYRLQVNRDPATLIALIAVKPDYPKRAPVFCLNLHWNGEHNVHNSENIRDLESLINTSFYGMEPKHQEHILSLQLQRLLTSLDVMLEAWNATLSGNGVKLDFPKENIFIHSVRGRTRSLPLWYHSMLQMYSQR